MGKENHKADIKLRVYSRSDNDIVLLWSCDKLTKDQQDNVTVLCANQPLIHKIVFLFPDTTKGIKGKCASCIIRHEENSMVSEEDYKIQVILGGKEASPISETITVLRQGTLPPFDKDRKASRVHLMGWDAEAEAWTKVPLVKAKDGTYAIPMVIVDRIEKKV